MNAADRRKVLTWTMALAAAVGAQYAGGATFCWDADGDDTAALGGSGTWDAGTPLWRSGSTTGPLTAWPNASPNADQARLQGTEGTITIAAGTTVCVNELQHCTKDRRWIFEGGDANALLQFSGASPKVSAGDSNTAVTFRNRIDAGSGVRMEQSGTGSGAFILETANQLQGSGPVTFAMGTSQYGAEMTITAAQDQFGGGFVLADGRRRNVTLNATLADALGTGVARATGYGTLVLGVWGAQTPVGGIPAGIFADRLGTIRLPTTAASTAKDRFTIGADGSLAGNAAALSSVTRVAAFSASPTGPEAILAPGAIVLHTQNDATTLGAAGTDADLLFGLDVNFTSAGFALTIGKGTPWKGLSNSTVNDGGTSSRQLRLQAGTVSIAAGTEQIVLQGFGVDYSYNDCALILGNGTTSPSFVALGDACPARIVRHVRIDASAPAFAGISAFDVTPGGLLVLLRAGASAGKPIALDSGRLWFTPATAGSTETIQEATCGGESGIYVARKTAGTPDTLALPAIARTGRSVLRISSSQAAGLGGDERVTLADTTGLVRGHIVDPWIQRTADFLEYGANGFAICGGYVTSLASLGDGVVFKGSGALAGNASLDSMIMTDNVSGTHTVTAGVLPDASRAARAGLMCTADNKSLAPAFDAGTAELLVHYPQGSTRVLSLNGGVTAGGLTKTGTGILSLRNGGNSIGGDITIWSGTLRIDNNGNGLNDDASVHAASGATYQILSPAADIETNARLSGDGMVSIASGKTLLVTERLTAGDANAVLTVASSGTLKLGAAAEAAFDLDLDSPAADVARLEMTTAALDLVDGAKVRIASVANLPSGGFEKTFTLIAYGSRSGSFDAQVACPEGVAGALSYDDVAKTVSVTVTKASGGGTVLLVQ